MKVAVVGAGFCGLALCWYLLEKGCCVDLYEQKGVGAGASGIASGLLHPYVGQNVRRNAYASDAMEDAKQLLSIAAEFAAEPLAEYCGIERVASQEQAEDLRKHALTYGDILELDKDRFLITSGISVFSNRYLQGLFSVCKRRGLREIRTRVESMRNLEGYDLCFFAVGAGVFSFQEAIPWGLRPVKGQSLLCRWKEPALTRPLLGKGHIIPFAEGLVHLGATYERGVLDDIPHPDLALQDLLPKARNLVPQWDPIEIQEAYAAVRVAQAGGRYFPLAKQTDTNSWCITGLGSRGILYHAYVAKQLVASLT